MKFFLWAGFLLFVFSCKQKEETIRPTVQNITESVYAFGKVKSKDQYEVYAPVSGIIQKVYVTDGSAIKKGDVLMTLANDVSALNQENARVATQYQSVEANVDKLNEAQVTIDLASAKRQNDSVLLERQRKLWANDIGSRNDLEQRELAVQNSATALQTAKLRYRQLKKQLEFTDKQAKKTLEISTAVTKDYSVRAIRDGKVYIVNKEPGELVSPQVPIAIIGDADGYILELQVDEYDISKIKQGQKVFITMDAHKGQVFEAVISKIDPLMNERTRSVTIEATFTEQPPYLVPNLSVEGNVLIRAKQDALTIPRNYLIDETYVLLQNGEKRKVSVGLKDYQWAEISSGLGKNDIIKKPVQ
ncbi:MAG: efflux RND transporter periplasmic adaptor subunit [Chitinophagaceae bacterium]|nr:MAG: efflux RND transporter periplasmic adaptor subunit [Chitinophagaceae bacterium]